MEALKRGDSSMAEKEQDPKFMRRVKTLKGWLAKHPFDFEAHGTLASLYLSKNMFAEAEYEQEIMEWLDRIKRSVNLNNG